MAETDTYGFTATREGDTIQVADNQGGGTAFVAGTRAEAAEGMRRYMEGLVRDFADEMAEELFGDEPDGYTDED